MVKNPLSSPKTQETWVRPLGREDPLEEETATRSSILAWRISWTEEPGRLHSPWGSKKELDMTEQLHKTHHGPQVHAIHLVKVKVIQSCPTHCDPVDYTALGILQARIQEWVAFPFFRGSSQPRDRTQISLPAGTFFTS